MKGYYTTSSAFKDKDYTELYKKTLNYIQFKLGKKNLSSWQDTPAMNEGKENDLDHALKVIKANEKAIRDCDIFIADVTEGSSGLGYEVGQAIHEKKPTLILRNRKESKYATQSSLSLGTNKLVTYKEYETIEQVTKIIDDFVEDAKGKIDTKFILIIPAEIDKYLSWSSDFRRMHKAQVVRTAVEAMMLKDKDWRDYQKQTTN
jgi:nucleoside 2-deoxyribosyltransferase